MARLKSIAKSDQLDLNLFLKSINITLDSENPERIKHFHPTGKSVLLIKALAGLEKDRAFFIIAPYGSGKSIASTFLLHLVENQTNSRPVISYISHNIKHLNHGLSDYITQIRKNPNSRGLVVTIYGLCENLPSYFKSSFLKSMNRVKLGREARSLKNIPCNNIQQIMEFLDLAKEKLKAKIDRIIIIWDEFGRHLETLVSKGRPTELMDLQTLAEYVSRSSDLPITLSLLLHQSLFNYAGNLPQSARLEWKKIEGRFNTIQYIDDSKEIYRLIADVVSLRRINGNPKHIQFETLAKKCKEDGIFKDFSNSELKKLFERSFPIEPITLYLLPRLSARVAQSERTLFNFINNVDLVNPVSPDALYDYFSVTMQSDIAIGGTYRRWLETQSALSKVSNESEAVKALKIACLLGLGISGEQSRVSRNLLTNAIRGYSDNGTEKCIEDLIARKLLLYRKHADAVSLWHGTDLDLRGKLEEEKDRWRGQFNLLRFLSKEVRPPVWRPLKYNDDFKIRRYLQSEYYDLSKFRSDFHFSLKLQDLPNEIDGKVLYLIPNNNEEIEEAKKIIINKIKNKRLIIALPKHPIPINESALEVWSLIQMQMDRDLVESDPLVIPELQQMLDDARHHLHQLVNRMTHPDSYGPTWFHEGSEKQINNIREFQNFISEVMRGLYPLTPIINNEMIVRKKPSPTVAAGRRKLLLGILERSGQPDLGIEGNFPDASLLRTVLIYPGLYRKENKEKWGYEAPENIADNGLMEVWRKFRDFFTTPQDTPKNISQFFEELSKPPFGLKSGLYPILFAAALKAFPNATSLIKDGSYIKDLLPSEIEQLCRDPKSYFLTVPKLNDKQIWYLRETFKLFSDEGVEIFDEKDLVRRCHDAFELWKSILPPAVLTTNFISDKAKAFQRIIFLDVDPIDFFFRRIPQAFGLKEFEQYEILIEEIKYCISELSNISDIFRKHAESSFRQSVNLTENNGHLPLRELALSWTNCFSEDFIKNINDDSAKGFFARINTKYDSDEIFLDSLSSLILGKSIERWDDSSTLIFDKEVKDLIRKIEEKAFLSIDNLQIDNLNKYDIARLIGGESQDF